MELTLCKDDLVSIVTIANTAGQMERDGIIFVDDYNDLLFAAQNILCKFHNSRTNNKFVPFVYDELRSSFKVSANT